MKGLSQPRVHRVALAFFILLCGFSSIKVPLNSAEYWALTLIPLLVMGGASINSVRRDGAASYLLRASYFRWYSVAWLCFMAGICVAAFANAGQGLYTVAKFAALYLISVYLLILAPVQQHLLHALKWWCGLGLVIFLGLWLGGVVDLLVLPPMRYGWVWAPPGVLWKAGMYLAPVCVWAALMKPGRVWAWVWLTLSCVVLSLDGSRTGTLLLAMFWLGLSILAMWRHGSSLALLSRSCLLAVMMVVASGMFNPSPWNPMWAVHQYASQSVPVEPGPVVPPPEPTAQRELTSDSIRIAMLKEAAHGAVANLPLGAGFGSTKVTVEGIPQPMVVHITYLQVLSDLGVLGLMGYLGIFAVPLGVSYKRLKRADVAWVEFDNLLLPLSIIGIYLASGFFHPLSNEISEWGIVLVAFALILRPAKAVSSS